eukprot:NODE_235_length_13458_cov_0.279737.p10 type:complete len:142 gc:universal NODE_235_length_13458_cov_0.279737:5936-6361(+)
MTCLTRFVAESVFLKTRSMSRNLYSVLGLNRKCTMNELDDRYKELALLKHPDKPTGTHDSFCELNNIYSFLKSKRSLYDHLMFDDLIVYDSVAISHFEFINNEFIYNCRCGGSYVLEQIDRKVFLNRKICSNCSLCIEIVY